MQNQQQSVPQPRPSQPAQPPRAAPPPSRMTIAALVRGKQKRPLRVVLYGVEGIGKSTFGASAPSPIFLGAEDGTGELDVARFPMPLSWPEVLEAIRALEGEDFKEFRTLVLDTLDWAEPLLWNYICKRDGQQNIESYGYGKGYLAAIDEWRVFLAALERLRERRGMQIVLLAHSHIKAFKNPEGEDFDRYQMKLHDKASGLIKEWCDVVLFANFETFASKDQKTKRARGVSTGARLLYTTRTAAYDAKNRHSLPESIPLNWDDFEQAVSAHKPAEPTDLRSEIERKIGLLPEAHRARPLAWLEKAGADAEKLAKLNDWCNANTPRE